MAYTGTGTQADPFVISTWEDLKAQMYQLGVWIALDPDAENKVMDLRDTEDRAGFTDQTVLRAHILGNGWTIRNVICHQGGHFYNSTSNLATIQDLNFENVLVLGNFAFNGRYNFVNCHFTAMLQKYTTFHYSMYAKYTNCALHLYFSPSCVPSYNTVLLQCDLTGCTFHVQGTWNGGSFFNRAVNCVQVTGNLKLVGNLELGSNTNDTNSFYDLTLTGTGTVTESTGGGSANLVNISGFGDGVTYSITGDNWYALTEDQLRDGAYLLSIGFPCVEA